ncbi:CD1375 family protein [Lachnotalea glycerini]|nr:CD1375 family protein [Lachnotalea glycerini]
MDYVYAFLIMKGEKVITQVPDKLQDAVKQRLENFIKSTID